MISDRPLLESTLESPLSAASVMNPSVSRKKRNVVGAVLLTSLIDAFSILVIYLLMNFSDAQTLENIQGVSLPSASQSTELSFKTIIKIVEDQYYLNDQLIKRSEIVRGLLSAKKKLIDSGEKSLSLVIQADKGNSFSKLNDLIVASGQAGFEEVKFAVLAK